MPTARAEQPRSRARPLSAVGARRSRTRHQHGHFDRRQRQWPLHREHRRPDASRRRRRVGEVRGRSVQQHPSWRQRDNEPDRTVQHERLLDHSGTVWALPRTSSTTRPYLRSTPRSSPLGTRSSSTHTSQTYGWANETLGTFSAYGYVNNHWYWFTEGSIYYGNLYYNKDLFTKMNIPEPTDMASLLGSGQDADRSGHLPRSSRLPDAARMVHEHLL